MQKECVYTINSDGSVTEGEAVGYVITDSVGEY